MSTPSSTNADDASVGADANNPSTGNEPSTGTTPTPAAGHTPQDQHQHATATGDEDSTVGTATKSDVSAEEAEDSKTAKDGTSDASAGTSGKTQDPVDPNKVIRIMGFRQETQEYLKKEYPTLQIFEEFLQLPSEDVKDMIRATTMTEDKKVDNADDVGENHKKGKKHARFNQAERAKLIVLRRWMKDTRAAGKEVELKDFNAKSYDEFLPKVDDIILEEIMEELSLSDVVKEKVKNENVRTPANLVEKSKYWYEHKIELSSSSTDVNEIEKFKKWYKYQLDTYLPSDWIVAFRKDSMNDKEIEWRKVLQAIGLKADAIQALEINDICDFSTLIYTSKNWKIDEPIDWKSFGLKENEARKIVNFRRWHNFYVTGKDNKWAAEFKAAHYERFVQRYTNPTKPDEFKTPGWCARLFPEQKLFDHLRLPQETQDYHGILQQSLEAGNLTNTQRYHLRQHYKGRREKMELIEEINEGVGDLSFQETRLGEIFEEEAADAHDKKKRDLLFFQKYYQFAFSALIVYLLLFCWFGTTVYFIFESDKAAKLASDKTTDATRVIAFLRENPEIINDWLSLTPAPTPAPTPATTPLSAGPLADFVAVQPQVLGASPEAFDDNRLELAPAPTAAPTAATTAATTAKPRAEDKTTFFENLQVFFDTYKGYEYVTFIHNILFGLASAVVIQELGEELKNTSLYHRFLGTYRERVKRSKKNIFKARLKLRRPCSFNYLFCVMPCGCTEYLWEWFKSLLTWLVLQSTRCYILFWILLGLISLAYGAFRGLEPSNPLYTTGQTWLGIAVTIGYSYFGLNDKNDTTIEDAKNTIDQKVKDAVQNAIAGGDGGSGGDEAKFTKEELESQLAEAEDGMGAAIGEGDIDGASKFHKKVIKLKRMLKEETKKEKEEALDGGDASGNKDKEEVATDKASNDNEKNEEGQKEKEKPEE